MKNAVLVSYSVSKWSNIRTDKKVSREVAEKYGIDTSDGSYKKRLIDSPLYKAITDAGQLGRDDYYSYTSPWSKGIAVCSVNALDVLTDKIESAKTAFNDAVDAFVAEWPELVEARRVKFGDLFKAGDYPTGSEVRAKFGIDFNVMPLDRDGHFDDIAEIVGTEVAQELAAKLSEQQTKQWAGAAKSAWTKLYSALKHAHDSLSKGQRLHGSSLDNLQELSDLLPVLNIANDPELDNRRRELNSLLRMYSIQSVQDKATRSKCAAEVHDIMAKINL